jgi:hypothetical protein
MRLLLMNPFVVFAFFAWLVLVLAPALTHPSWRRLLLAVPLTLVGVLLPLFVFAFSAFLVPEWKGGCDHGWVDCFHVGKLALTPFVLWATAALYAVEVCRVAKPTARWIVLGFFFGAMVSSVCLVYGLVFCGLQKSGMAAWLLVPAYVPVWYITRAIQLMSAASFRPVAYVIASCSSLPFWFGAVVWSRRTYEALPDQAPSCFVVTAATRGHRRFVGPFVEVTHRGHLVQANQQLMTLWRFEALWRARTPRSHARFRRAYNRAGPAIARSITSPWIADLAYLALKPAEFLAGFAGRLNSGSNGNQGLSPLPLLRKTTL